jgi:outer membrane protein assembly factor BamD
MAKKIHLLPILILCVALLLGGCSALNPFSGSKGPQTAAELLRAGQEAMDKGNYSRAATYFQRIKEDHPFSRQTPEAELGLADAYFRQGEYSAAESAYKEYESLHPGDPKIPYVLFRIGRANLKQFVSVDLSQQEVREAQEYFNRLVQAYPRSEYAERARKHIHKCLTQRAHHELYVANFYMRTQKYRAAWRRYSFVLENYEEVKECAEYARDRAQEAYYRALKQSSEETRAANRGSWRHWFEWL